LGDDQSGFQDADCLYQMVGTVVAHDLWGKRFLAPSFEDRRAQQQVRHREAVKQVGALAVGEGDPFGIMVDERLAV